MDVPTIAPPTAFIENADLKITANVAGKFAMFAKMTTRAPQK
jgi:hypothetical protein